MVTQGHAGINRSIISHRPAVDLSVRPIQQKKMYLYSERKEFVKKDVGTLLTIKQV